MPGLFAGIWVLNKFCKEGKMRTQHKLIITLILILGFSLSGLYAQDYPQLYFLTGFHWYSSSGLEPGPQWSESEWQTFNYQNADPLNIRSIHETYRFDGSLEFIHTDSTYADRKSVV